MMGEFNINLIASVCAANFLAFATGNAYAWSSSALVSLKNKDAMINPLGRAITSIEESWIASLINLGATCGPVMAGYCSSKYGRKKTLMLFSIPMLLSHLILAYASTPVLFYIARFMVGLGTGCVFTVMPVYVGEIAETRIRGLLGNVMGVFIASGLLFVYTVGSMVDLKTLSFILMVPIILFQFFFGLFVPESPYYHITKGDETSAEKSLNKLRKYDHCSILKELGEIKKTVDESNSNKTSLFQFWKLKSFRRGITVTITLMVLQQFVGITTILSYMENIFIASGSSISSSTSTILVAVVQLLAVILSTYLSDKWGRRMLLILSSAGIALPLFSLGLYFYIKSTGSDVSSLWWLPIACLIFYILSFNFGLAFLPWVFTGELFSSQTKSVGSTVTATICVALAFIIALLFPTMVEILGYQGVFWLFGGSALLGVVFIIWYVPETKGKTFQEILKHLGE